MQLRVCRTDVRHDAVVVVAAPVLEHDVRVVVDDELVEARLGAPDATLDRSTGAQRVLRDVRHVLLEDERRLLASCPALTGAAARTTREHLAQSAPRDHRRHQQPRSHHSLTVSCTPSTAGLVNLPSSAIDVRPTALPPVLTGASK